ncbi:MAG: ribonuclease J [Alphaproteobacteria bacterium]|nr:ribonuclease J [Alphaproteobacteria bacterium]MCL2758140.1 ribonuclease J [Alphaproteobacteria bacterium]
MVKVKQDQIANLAFLDDRFDDEFAEDYDEFDDGKSAAIAATKKVAKPKAENKKSKDGAAPKSESKKQKPDAGENDGIVHFFAMGGMEHIGQNMYVYRYRGKYLIVDCGMGFLDSDVGGDDVKYCDTTWLEKRKKDVVGIILTHGHEDHVGALKYVWEKFRCPIYCTRFVAKFMKRTFDGMEIDYKPSDIVTFDHNGANFNVGPFAIETFHVSHSVPEAQMLLIKTAAGKILHTGDWTFNDAIPIENPTDYKRLREIGSDPDLLACVCESTAVGRQEVQTTEVEVRETLAEIMAKAPGRVFVSGYSRSIARMKMFADAAREVGREPAIKERSNPRPVPYVGLPEFRDIAIECGYLKKDDVALHRDIKELPGHMQAIYLTGHQGEKYAMLTRLCRGHVKELKLMPTDTVVFSAIVIPGREAQVSFLYNRLAKIGVTTKTIYDTPKVHASGHAGRPEYERFYDIVHPHVILPMHGEYMTCLLNAKMAMERGGAKHMSILRNGEIVALQRGEAPVVVETIKTGFIVMEGETERMGSDDPVLKNRQKLSTEGAVFVTLPVDKRGYLKDTPEVSSAGVFEHDGKGLIRRQIQIEITKAIDALGKADRKSQETLRESVATAVKKVIRPIMGDRKSPSVQVHFIYK